MSRLHRPGPEELTVDQRAVYDELARGERTSDNAIELADADGRLNGPFNAMVVAPGIGGPLGRLGAALRFHGSLSARSREVAILAVAADKQSRYELYAHARIASSAGLTDDEIAALCAGNRPATLDPGERAGYELATHLLHDEAVDDVEYDRLRALLGEAGIVEVSTLVGYYCLLAIQLSLFRVDAPIGDD